MADPNEPQDLTAEQEDTLLREAFANVGKRQNPPQAKLDRWEASFRAELGQKIGARKQRRAYVGAGAAVVLMLVGIAQFIVPPTPAAPVVATVVADKNGNKLYSGREVLVVYPGLEIKVGDALHTGHKGHLALSYHDADIRLRGDTSVRFHAAKLELMHGALYVDTHNQSSIPPGTVIVSTDHGSFTHTGTQFVVQTSKEEVVAAVREGAIITSAQSEPLSAKDGARQIRITAAGQVNRQPIDRHGGVWGWVADAAPGFDEPHATADDVLRWATRELGVELIYDERTNAEAHAKSPIGIPASGVRVEHVAELVQKISKMSIEQTASRWLVSHSN